MADVMPPVQSVSLSSPASVILKPFDNPIAMCIISVCEFCRPTNSSISHRSKSSVKHAQMQHGKAKPVQKIMRLCR